MPDFGDNVRVKDTTETQAAGIAGRLGNVYGFTTPSVSGVDVIGSKAEDLAYSVNIDELKQQFWLARDLIEVVDHGTGIEIRLDGVPITWRREADGTWSEHPDETTWNEKALVKKPWWRFW